MTEDEFLESLFKRLPFPSDGIVIPPGDDCAGLRINGSRILLVAIDQVVGGRHYRLIGPGAAKPEEVGRKLLSRNLSDVAAMGGRPLYCLVALGMAPRRSRRWLDRFFDGIVSLAREFGVFMIGGDLALTLADEVASLAVLGEVPGKKVVRRSGAHPGDALFATGCFGGSLRTGHHLLFRPRCREGEWLAMRRYARAMIDVSDGLLLDARRLCRASGTGLMLNTGNIPRRTPGTTLQQALTDGEDYELIFAVSRRRVKRLKDEWPFKDTALTEIGRFVESESPVVYGPDGLPITVKGGDGYDHFLSGG